MSNIEHNKDAKQQGTFDNIKTSDVIISKPNPDPQQIKDSKIKTSNLPKELKISKDQESKPVTKELKQSKDQEPVTKKLKHSKEQEPKPTTKETGKSQKVPGKGEAKLRNLLKDPRVLQDVENLFEDLKGSKGDDSVDSSTILFLFNMLEISKTEPEYYWYIYTQVKDTDKLSKTQFIELFMNPPEYKPNDIEDIRNLFQIFDVKDKGSFSKNEFIEFFKFSPIYQSNPELVEDNLEKCFMNIQKIFGNREITPVEFFQIINQNKSGN